MQSRTSFFNGHVLKKDITRFAPLWAVYTVFLAVWVFNNAASMLRNAGTEQLAYTVSRNIGDISYLFLIYGFVCATLLFGDLFKTRMAGGLHAMPLRRETWFGTHVTAGILFAAVPNALIAIVLAIMLGEYAFVAGLWWLVLTGQFLFHFGLGVLCVQLAGNLLGHAATFCTVEFFSLLVYGIYESVYEPLLYGIITESKWFEFFAPVQYWNYRDWMQWDVQNAEAAMEAYSFVSAQPAVTQTKYIYEGIITKEWLYLAVCVVLSIGFLALALTLYRRRKLEWAGDFITSPVMGWVFLILGSVCAAIVVPVVGFVIAFFGILMLWERTLKVFRKKNLIAFGITVAAVLLTLGMTSLDVAGITTKVPQQADIQFVTLNPRWGSNTTVLTDAEDIRAVMDAHEYALVDRDPEDGDWYSLELEYTLKNGSTMRRYYYLKADVPAMKGIERILSTWENVFDGADPESVRDSLERVTLWQEVYDENGMYISANEVAIPEEAIGGLLEAIRQDCQEGTMAQNMAFHEEEYASLTFWYADSFDGRYIRNSLTVFGDSAHTVAALEQYLQ